MGCGEQRQYSGGTSYPGNGRQISPRLTGATQRREPMAEIGLFEAIDSLPQITRYKPDPVPREAIDKIIEAATKAPNGGNTQPWEFIAITDRDLTTKIGQIYRDAWLGAMGAVPPPNESSVYRAARYLANHMPEVPAMILVCVDHTRGSAPYTP